MIEIDRLTRMATRSARRYGARAAVYANALSFDVMCERNADNKSAGGVIWVKCKTKDAYLSPATVARNIRAEIRRAWNE